MRRLRERLLELYRAAAAGEDVPPAPRLRAEGMMETLRMLGIASEAQLAAELAAAYREALGRELAVDWGENWRERFPFPQLPLFTARAPVYPSTGGGAG